VERVAREKRKRKKAQVPNKPKVRNGQGPGRKISRQPWDYEKEGGKLDCRDRGEGLGGKQKK